MINLQNLKVTVQNADIAPMVLSLTMFETIKGNVRGSMTVLDNMNFMDTFIATTHAPIEIHWQYESYPFTFKFYGDGEGILTLGTPSSYSARLLLPICWRAKFCTPSLYLLLYRLYISIGPFKNP